MSLMLSDEEAKLIMALREKNGHRKPERKTWERWAYVSPSGSVFVDHDCATELEVWQSVGYDTLEKAEAAKQRGARVIRVRIEEICDE